LRIGSGVHLSRFIPSVDAWSGYSDLDPLSSWFIFCLLTLQSPVTSGQYVEDLAGVCRHAVMQIDCQLLQPREN